MSPKMLVCQMLGNAPHVPIRFYYRVLQLGLGKQLHIIVQTLITVSYSNADPPPYCLEFRPQ